VDGGVQQVARDACSGATVMWNLACCGRLGCGGGRHSLSWQGACTTVKCVKVVAAVFDTL
jgi:hypothetical protein